MTREEVFNIWAPPEGLWSDWAKPVLFAHMKPGPIAAAAEPPLQIDAAYIPPADGRTAVVIDLPGNLAVAFGLVAATAGYRPVPLYNAVPPRGTLTCTLDLTPIIHALVAGAATLKGLDLPPNAPPAFLLDSWRRIGTQGTLSDGIFDNRWVLLPTDFPSASLLRSRGFTRAVLIQSAGLQPLEDLAHTLLRWQQGGIGIEAVNLASSGEPTPIAIRRPFLFRALWHRFLATLRLKRSPLGGFGGELPAVGSGG